MLPDDERLRGDLAAAGARHRSPTSATAADMELFMQLKVQALQAQGLISAEGAAAEGAEGEPGSPNPWQANRAQGGIVSA